MVEIGTIITSALAVTVFLIILAQVTIPIGFQEFQAEINDDVNSSRNPNLTDNTRDILEVMPIIIVVAFIVLIFAGFGLMRSNM